MKTTDCLSFYNLVIFSGVDPSSVVRTEPGCSVKGQGGLKTSLKLDLTRPQGSEGSCGVKYNTVGTNSYYICSITCPFTLHIFFRSLIYGSVIFCLLVF